VPVACEALTLLRNSLRYPFKYSPYVPRFGEEEPFPLGDRVDVCFFTTSAIRPHDGLQVEARPHMVVLGCFWGGGALAVELVEALCALRLSLSFSFLRRS